MNRSNLRERYEQLYCGNYVMQSNCFYHHKKYIYLAKESEVVVFTSDKIYLNSGRYSITTTVFDETISKFYHWVPNIQTFKVTGDFIGDSVYQNPGEWTIE